MAKPQATAAAGATEPCASAGAIAPPGREAELGERRALSQAGGGGLG